MNISPINLVDFSTGNPVDSSTILNKEPLVRSFNFFGEKPEEEEKEYTKKEHLDALKAAEEKAFEEGYKKGKSEMDNYISSEDIKIKEQISIMLAKFSENLGSFKQETQDFKIETAKIASHAVRKIFSDKVNEKIEEIIIDALAKSVELIKKEPQLKFKATKTVIDKIRTSVEEFFKSNNLSIKTIFEEVPEINNAMIAIEWENSGIKIDLNERMQEIDKILAEFIKSL